MQKSVTGTFKEKFHFFFLPSIAFKLKDKTNEIKVVFAAVHLTICADILVLLVRRGCSLILSYAFFWSAWVSPAEDLCCCSPSAHTVRVPLGASPAVTAVPRSMVWAAFLLGFSGEAPFSVGSLSVSLVGQGLLRFCEVELRRCYLMSCCLHAVTCVSDVHPPSSYCSVSN